VEGERYAVAVELDLPGLAVRSLGEVVPCLKAGGVCFDRRDGCIVAPFPAPLGDGCWAFVEDAAALPWRA
jgi:hypothetical protein